MALPQVEGTDARWRPITVGHELAHYFIRTIGGPTGMDVSDQPDADALVRERQGLPSRLREGPHQKDYVVRVFQEIAQLWVEELYCDALLCTSLAQPAPRPWLKTLSM